MGTSMNYKKFIPPDTFISEYMQYMSYVETAESYDFWCALWAIGTGVGRDVYVDRPNSPVYHNWYIILAAEAGTTRKSTAISSILSVIEGTDSILTGKTSPESLELYLHDRCREGGTAKAHFAVSELVTILGREGYMSTMPGLLTDLYDCQKLRTSPGTLQMGELVQRDVYVTFLSASTPSWLVTAINPSVIEGGFTSRVIFVVDDNRKRSIAWPTKREDDHRGKVHESFNETIQAARDVSRIGISEGGLKRFTSWYNTRASHTDPFQSGFEAREDDHLLRIASCLAINDGTREIQSKHIGYGSKIINEAKNRANSLFGGDFSYRAKLVGGIEKVRDHLISADSDGIKHHELHNKVQRQLDASEFKMLMNIMHECGMVQVFKVKSGKSTGTFYRATKAIEKFGVSSEVLSSLNL
tara:strand:- start:551 stop:1792 length:1242 start_codon:yes stop_codon:yes gene_type:complete